MFVRTGRARLVVFVLLPRALAGWMRAVFREVLKHVKVDRVARNLLPRRRGGSFVQIPFYCWSKHFQYSFMNAPFGVVDL